jgi:hypothetical protein
MASFLASNIITKTQLFGFGTFLGVSSIIFDSNQNGDNISENSKNTRMMGYAITSQFNFSISSRNNIIIFEKNLIYYSNGH